MAPSYLDVGVTVRQPRRNPVLNFLFCGNSVGPLFGLVGSSITSVNELLFLQVCCLFGPSFEVFNLAAPNIFSAWRYTVEES